MSGARIDATVSSSRDSLAGAGWRCEKSGVPVSGGRSFSWIDPVPIWQSRNQYLARLFGDPTNDERRLWMELQRQKGELPEDLVVSDHADLEEVSFIVVGDTGEGDASQRAVVKPLLASGRGTDFMVVCSDVIYPAGDAEDYDAKFYRPYEGYRSPIYALPGNHDWYDGLVGFMHHLCGAEVSALPAAEGRPSSLKERLRRLLWRRPAKRSFEELPVRRRGETGRRSDQRSPYFAIDTGPLLIVGIDTGMGGPIDREQAGWLRRISREVDKPKILLTGKPLYVDGEHHPYPMEDGGTVDEIVREADHGYVAAIGGDIHNYQRYSVEVGGRDAPLHYIVSGGGGAYMSATHRIPKVDLSGVGEDDFVCYPRRGDSLSFYSKLYDRRLGLGRGWLEIAPGQAARYMAERLGIEPARPEDRDAHVSSRTRRIADWIFPLPGSGRNLLHNFFSEFFDWNDPPLFKNFLRIDASSNEIRIRCFAATGCAEHEPRPPLEDEVRIVSLEL
ncbi:MAG: metallophosphoesterase family protein [Rubrobacter sp.]